MDSVCYKCDTQCDWRTEKIKGHLPDALNPLNFLRLDSCKVFWWLDSSLNFIYNIDALQTTLSRHGSMFKDSNLYI